MNLISGNTGGLAYLTSAIMHESETFKMWR